MGDFLLQHELALIVTALILMGSASAIYLAFKRFMKRVG